MDIDYKSYDNNLLSRYVLHFLNGPRKGQVMIRNELPVLFGIYVRKDLKLDKRGHYHGYYFVYGEEP